MQFLDGMLLIQLKFTSLFSGLGKTDRIKINPIRIPYVINIGGRVPLPLKKALKQEI